MRTQKVNVHTRATRAAERTNGDSKRLQGGLQHGGFESLPDEPFPYLEKLVDAVKKYPYATVGVMISIATLIMSAVTVVAVSVGGGMFLMYGEMKANTALMQEILTKQKTIEDRQDNDGKVLRAYASVNGKRIEFIVGLLSKEGQAKVNDYDRAHPDPLIPAPDDGRNQ